MHPQSKTPNFICQTCGKATYRYPHRIARSKRLFCSRACSRLDARNLSDRLWEKVDQRGANECWEWRGTRSPRGYGMFRIKVQGVWTNRHATRVTWELMHGPIPDGYNVCHKCDNPPCVNPKHLFLGTQSDNAQDMIRKGRNNAAVGERQGNAKLTWADVKQIRSLYQPRIFGLKRLSKMFGVHNVTILRIIQGRMWKDEPK